MRKTELIEAWYHEYGQDLHHFLVYYTGENDVDDLLQEVFIKAYRSLPSYKGEASAKTWLLTMARRTSIDYARKTKLNRLLPLKLESDVHQTPEELILLKERNQILYQCISELKRNYRDVIVCRGIMELSTRETMQVLGWSKEKVDTTFLRAKRHLREMIESKGRDFYEKG